MLLIGFSSWDMHAKIDLGDSLDVAACSARDFQRTCVLLPHLLLVK